MLSGAIHFTGSRAFQNKTQEGVSGDVTLRLFLTYVSTEMTVKETGTVRKHCQSVQRSLKVTRIHSDLLRFIF